VALDLYPLDLGSVHGWDVLIIQCPPHGQAHTAIPDVVAMIVSGFFHERRREHDPRRRQGIADGGCARMIWERAGDEGSNIDKFRCGQEGSARRDMRYWREKRELGNHRVEA
jgi:hypothetical protein